MISFSKFEVYSVILCQLRRSRPAIQQGGINYFKMEKCKNFTIYLSLCARSCEANFRWFGDGQKNHLARKAGFSETKRPGRKKK